jgi:hypothetical protein
MKTPKNLNTQCVDIFLIIPMNILVPHADKPSNGYGQCNKGRGEILMEIWKQTESSDTEEELVREYNQNGKFKEGVCFAIFPDRIACGSRSEKYWSCEVFLMVTSSGKGRLNRRGMKVWKFFSDKGCSWI